MRAPLRLPLAYPDVPIKEARRKAAAYSDDAAAGRNPLTDFEENAVDKRDTVAALVEDYVAHAERSMRSWRNARWTLNRHIVSAWREKPAGGVTDSDAKALIDKIAKGIPDPDTGVTIRRHGAANEVRKWGSLLFQWAIDERRTKANPFAKMKAPKLGTRQRYLSMDEARAVWAAASDMREPWGQAKRKGSEFFYQSKLSQDQYDMVTSYKVITFTEMMSSAVKYSRISSANKTPHDARALTLLRDCAANL